MTRAEFAKVVVAALVLEEKTSINYLDVNDDFWGKEYIQKVSKYFSGYEEENGYMFYPNKLAIREDMAVALVKATGHSDLEYDLSVLDRFTDKDEISNELKVYMAIAVENGIINGYDDNTIRPKGTLTRAEATQLVFNVNYVKVDKKNSDFQENYDDPKLQSEECEMAKNVFQEFVDIGKYIDERIYSNSFFFLINSTCILNSNTCFTVVTGVPWQTGMTYLVDVSNGEENAIIYYAGYNEININDNIRIAYKKNNNENPLLLKKIAQEVYNYIPNLNYFDSPCAYQGEKIKITKEDLSLNQLLSNAFTLYDSKMNSIYEKIDAVELQKVVKQIYGQELKNETFYAYKNNGQYVVCNYINGIYVIENIDEIDKKDENVRDMSNVYIEGDYIYIYDKYLYICHDKTYDNEYTNKYYGSSDRMFEFIRDDDEMNLGYHNLFQYLKFYKNYLHTFKKASDGSYYWYSTEKYNFYNNIKEENIKKIYKEKDIVYTSYKEKDVINLNDSNNTEWIIQYSLPYINIDSNYAKEINDEIKKLDIEPRKEVIKEINEDGIEYNSLCEKSYMSYLNNNILSIVIITSNNVSTLYRVYNIDINTGNKVSNLDIIKSKNLTKEKYVNKLRNSYIAEDMENGYSMDVPVFLGSNGDINIIPVVYPLAGQDGNQVIINLEKSSVV